MDELPRGKLIASLRCAVCGQHYHLHELKVVGHLDAMWYLNVHCVSCGSRGMMAVVFGESGEHPEITDLSSNEQRQFLDAPAVGEDDILEVHDFLKGFDGDFGELFVQK